MVWILALLIGGCGDGSPDRISDAAVAKATLIGEADLPKEWQKARPLPLIHCGSNPFRKAVAISKAHYAAGLADLQQQVAVFKSKAEAEEVYFELISKRGFNCFRKRSEAEISAYSGGKILKPLRVLQEEAPTRSAQVKRTSVEVASPIGPAGVYLDVAYAQAGRTVMFLKISGGLAPVEEQFFKDITRLTRRRVKSASGI